MNTNPPRFSVSKPFILRASLFAVCSLAAFLLAFVIPDTEQAEMLFIVLGYPSTFILVAGLIVSLVLYLKNTKPNALRQLRSREELFLLAVCIVASVFLYTREGGGFKIPFDEQLLTNVSQNMHSHHLPVMSETTFQSLARYEMIDKRPLLFPFILSLAHGISGYRPENAFYLNFALTVLFLFLLFKTVERIFSRKAGYFSIALASFMPIIGQNSSGGGFEMLNLCCILLVGLLSMDYWRRPDNLTLTALLFATAAASNVRYESPIIIAPVGLLALAVWIRERRPSLPWATLILPFLFLPLVWQFRAISANAEGFQYRTEGEGSFSLSYVIPNIDAAYRFLFIPEYVVAGSPFVGFVGIAGLLLIGTFALTRRNEVFANQPNRVAFLVTVLYVLLQTALILTFFFGKLDVTITSRLGLPLMLLLFISGGILLAIVFDKKRAGPYLAYGFLSLTALYAFKMYSLNRYTRVNTVHDSVEWALEFAESLPKGNYLFASAFPKVFEIEGFNNISITRLRSDLDKLKFHVDYSTYRDIFVIQSGMVKQTEDGVERRLLPLHRLSPALKLEKISEASFSTHNFIRLSRLVDVDMDLHEEIPVEESDAVQFYTPDDEEVRRFQKSLL